MCPSSQKKNIVQSCSDHSNHYNLQLIVCVFSIAGADIVQTGGTVSLPSVSVSQADVHEQFVTKGIADNVLTEKNQMSQDSGK